MFRPAVFTFVCLLSSGVCCAQEVETIEPQVLPTLPSRPIADISISISPRGEKLPRDVAKVLVEEANAGADGHMSQRSWGESAYAWTAPAIAHKPLLFEDVNLERYGHHYGVLQPVVSAAHFYGRLPVLPYMRGAQPSSQPHYNLGYYRPGDCAPHYFSRPRASWRGALYQGAATVGGIFLVP